MPRQGKRYRMAMGKVEKERKYTPEEALDLIKEVSSCGFDETVEVAVALNIKPKERGERIRGTVILPRGLGRKIRVLVFAAGDEVEKAREKGADWVGGKELAEKIEQGWREFDAVVSTPQMMKVVARLGRILGPQHLMPSPKIGTVTEQPSRVVEELKKGKIEYRNDATGVIHAPLGKVSFSREALLENFETLLKAIGKDKPASVKGRYLKTLFLSSTMGPGLKINPQKVTGLS